MRFSSELKLEPLFGEENLFLPDYSNSIALVSDTIEGIFLGKKRGLDFSLPKSNRVILLFIDSVGFSEFKAFCEKVKPRVLNTGSCFCISSIAPTTTCVCAVAINTGAVPSQTNFFLHRLYFEEEESIFDFLDFNKIYPSLEAIPEEKSQELLKRFSFKETIFERLEKKGIPAFSVIPKKIENSPLRRVTDKGANTITYEGLSELVIKARNALKDKQKFFCSIYWPYPDELSHAFGTSEGIFLDLDLFFQAIEWLSQELNDCLFLVVSDHGRVELKKTFFSNDDEKLNSLLVVPPFGDGRFANLKAKQGKQKELSDYLNEKYGSDFLILEREQVLDSGLYGSGGAESERIGDFVVLAREPVKLVFDAKGKRKTQLATHSGLTKKELLVPFAYFKN